MRISAEFERYLESLCEGLGHADRHTGLKDYCSALMLPLERKSVEPLAAAVDPMHVSARHQSLHHFVAKSSWSDEAVLERVCQYVVPKMGTGSGTYWIVDDTGMAKKGMHSVGVARQYCGQLGKQDNCQVAVSLSIATATASLPVAWRLYLPKTWAEDPVRREKCQVPEQVRFATKPHIALEQIRTACERKRARGVVLADAGYGNDHKFREGLDELKLRYCVGVQPSTGVWAPGTAPLPPKRRRPGPGRPPSRWRTGPAHRPVSVKTLAMELGPRAWRTVTWREGTNTPLCSRFAAVRVRATRGDHQRSVVRDEQWLLIEWPEGEHEPTKYWLGTLAPSTSLKTLVSTAKMRWRIERDYLELKQEFGLSHYEGRGWRGFHHHATLSIAAYGFLVARRLAQPHSKKNAIARQIPALSEGYRPRGSPAGAAPR